jgi:hypothetical protein
MVNRDPHGYLLDIAAGNRCEVVIGMDTRAGYLGTRVL